MQAHKVKIQYFVQLILAIYLGWYVLFESMELPFKFDTHMHYVRSLNLLNDLKDFKLFSSWYESPFWGYPENFVHYPIYLVCALLGLFIPLSLVLKIIMVLTLFLSSFSIRNFLEKFIHADNFQKFIGACLYMGSASFLNFALGSSSPPRIAGIAIFPFVMTKFIEWYKNKKNYRAKYNFILIFYLSYLLHPITAFSSVITIFIYLLFNLNEFVKKESLKRLLSLIAWGIPLFAWQLGSILISRQYLSWDDIFAYYQTFPVKLSIMTFLSFYKPISEQMHVHYFGFFPLLAATLSLFFLKKEHKVKKELLISFAFVLSGILILILGPVSIKWFTFRLDVIYWLGISVTASYFLTKIKYKSLVVLLTFAMIIEQTWYCRTYPGKDYVSQEQIKEIREKTKGKIKRARIILDKIIKTPYTPEQLTWINGSYNGFFTHGFLEIHPYNLGRLYHERDLQNIDSLFKLQGLATVQEQDTVGNATVYNRFIYVNAPSRKDSYEKVFRRLIDNKSFLPDKMPLVFVKSQSPIILQTQDRSQFFSITDKDWQEQVITYFEDSFPIEKEEFISEEKKLLVIKEAYHPRRKLFAKGKSRKSFAVEPGLIGYISDESHKLNIENMFTWWEKILGFISIFTLMTLLILLKNAYRQQ